LKPYQWIKCCNPSCGKWRVLSRGISLSTILGVPNNSELNNNISKGNGGNEKYRDRNNNNNNNSSNGDDGGGTSSKDPTDKAIDKNLSRNERAGYNPLYTNSIPTNHSKSLSFRGQSHEERQWYCVMNWWDEGVASCNARQECLPESLTDDFFLPFFCFTGGEERKNPNV